MKSSLSHLDLRLFTCLPNNFRSPHSKWLFIVSTVVGLLFNKARSLYPGVGVLGGTCKQVGSKRTNYRCQGCRCIISRALRSPATILSYGTETNCFYLLPSSYPYRDGFPCQIKKKKKKNSTKKCCIHSSIDVSSHDKRRSLSFVFSSADTPRFTISRSLCTPFFARISLQLVTG